MALAPLLHVNQNGLFCEAGDFYVDPWAPVDRAVITHAHADHATPGSRSYLTTPEGTPLLRARLGEETAIETLPYGETREIGGVRVSLHPAGHILGSAQVRVERAGEVWVVSGDYKLAPDPTCRPFEPVRCHTFVTEATFGLPIFRWQPQAEVLSDINAWWRATRDAGKAALLFAYAAGKAQRLLAGIDASIGPIYTHGAIESLNQIYRAAGVPLAPTIAVADAPPRTSWRGALILAPPFSMGDPWTRRFGTFSTGLASGWMRIRGPRRRRALDRGFVLSDHADWPALLRAIGETGEERVLVTHGYRGPLAQWLIEQGYRAEALETPFSGVEEES